MKRRERFFRLGMYLLLMIVVALTSTAVTMRLAIHGAEVGVPDLTNLTLPDARQRAQAAHLSATIDGRYYSGDVPAGHVLTQIPAAGTVVRRGWRVRVSESLGPRKVAIPDVVGQPERISSIRIRRLGLELGTVAHLPFQSENPDVVFAQNPPASSTDITRPRVSILIADAPTAAEVSYVMPDFVGQLLATADDAIRRAGLHLARQQPQTPAPAQPTGAMTSFDSNNAASTPAPIAPAPTPTPAPAPTPAEEATPRIPSGTITAQFPLAGSRVDAETLIRLTVSP